MNQNQKNEVQGFRSIGNYIIGKTLGEGTFGKVKLGTHTLTGEKVAIKILEKSKILDASDVERVTREIHILKLIRHPNIIQLYQIIETPRQLYLIMEYANGGELFDYIVENTKVDEKQACRFFQQIVSGLDYLHKIGVVHRDLKPENLLLDSHNNIKIVDFGLSNTYKQKELLNTACGSPCYAAPEMIAGNKYDPSLVDIWSSGVILFALVCGYLPFEDPNTSKLYKKILNGSYDIPNYLTAECVDILSKILNKDPDQRYRIPQIKRHFWYQQISQKLDTGILVGYDTIQIDFSILQHLQQFNINCKEAQKCIEANRHNHLSTTYYLLKKQIERNKRSVSFNSTVDTIKLEQPYQRQSNPLSPHPPIPRLSLESAFSFADRKKKEFHRPGSTTSNPRTLLQQKFELPRNDRKSTSVQRRQRISKHQYLPKSVRNSSTPAQNPQGSTRLRRRVYIRSESIKPGTVQIHIAGNSEIVHQRICKIVAILGILFKIFKDKQIKCYKDGVKFNIETHPHDNLKTAVCFKRLSGDLWKYRDICRKVIAFIKKRTNQSL